MFSGGVFYAPQPFVFYDVTLPATPATVVASATLTGRADPDHTNDTSTVTIDVDEPAAEIYTQITPVVDPIPSQEATLVDGPVLNAGELDADELVAVFEAPADWEIEVPPGPLPPGVACEVIVSPHAMRCTRTHAAGGRGMVGRRTRHTTGGHRHRRSQPRRLDGDARDRDLPERREHDDPVRTARRLVRSTSRPTPTSQDGDAVTFSGTGFTPNAADLLLRGPRHRHDSAMRPTAACPFLSTAVRRERRVQRHRDRRALPRGRGRRRRRLRATGGDVRHRCRRLPVAGWVCRHRADDVHAPAARRRPFRRSHQPAQSWTRPAHPVLGATVWAYRSSDGWVAPLRTTTDASGNYVLEDAEPGIAYRLRFGAPTGRAW